MKRNEVPKTSEFMVKNRFAAQDIFLFKPLIFFLFYFLTSLNSGFSQLPSTVTVEILRPKIRIGQTTRVLITAHGLNQLEDVGRQDYHFRIGIYPPDVAALNSLSNILTVPIDWANVTPEGTFATELPLIGLRPGTYVVSADLIAGLVENEKEPLPTEVGTGCLCTSDSVKKEDDPDIVLAPFVIENWQELQERIDGSIKNLENQGEKEKAEQLKRQKPPETPEAYEEKIKEAMKNGEDFEFTIVKAAAMVMADGPAVFGNASPFAMEMPPIKEMFTMTANKKSPLKTKKVTGSETVRLGCNHEHCEFLGAAATFIGLKGKAQVMNLTEIGASDEQITALKMFAEKMPLPSKFPILEKIREMVLHFTNFEADIETRVAAGIKVESKDFGIKDRISLVARARLIKSEDGEAKEKYTSVGTKQNNEGEQIESADVEFARGISERHPSTIEFSANIEARAKALGIGAAESQINSTWGLIYIFSCNDKNNGEPCAYTQYKIIANTQLGEQINAAMEEVAREVNKIKAPTKRNEAEEVSRKLEKLLEEKIGPIFEND